MIRDGLQERVHQRDVDHGSLIDHEEITVERTFFVFAFEGLRGVLLDHVLRADLMLTGLAINSLLFAAAAVGSARLLASARRAGTLLQMGE
jgi:hypothetical protein